MVRILHISTTDIRGGAARAAHRLHTGLKAQGQESQLYVLHRLGSEQDAVEFKPPAKELSRDLYSRVRRRLAREYGAARLRLEGRHAETRTVKDYRVSRPLGYEPFSNHRVVFGPAVVSQSPSAEIVNLHWVTGFVDYRSFFETYAGQIPMVWTLHDMAPLTGGCHYDGGCGRFVNGCGRCPQLGSSRSDDLSRFNLMDKASIFNSLEPWHLRIVTPSRWLADQVAASKTLSRFPCRVVPYGLDTEVFSPVDQATARSILGISNGHPVVMFLAETTTNRRKGYEVLLQAIDRITEMPDLTLMSVGNRYPDSPDHVRHVHCGSVNNDRLLSLMYSAADLFVIPSLQDNLPNAVLESLACGTPVIGFHVGGIPDMVHSGVTGETVARENSSELAETIVKVLRDPAYLSKLSSNCRKAAVEKYGHIRQAEHYLGIYRQMLDDFSVRN